MLYLAMQNFSCTHRVISSSNTLSTADASQLCVSVVISCVSDGADTLQFESIQLSLTAAHTSLGLCECNCNPNSTSTTTVVFSSNSCTYSNFAHCVHKRTPWLLLFNPSKTFMLLWGEHYSLITRSLPFEKVCGWVYTSACVTGTELMPALTAVQERAVSTQANSGYRSPAPSLRL